jgi:hypothetical protein
MYCIFIVIKERLYNDTFYLFSLALFISLNFPFIFFGLSGLPFASILWIITQSRLARVYCIYNLKCTACKNPASGKQEDPSKLYLKDIQELSYTTKKIFPLIHTS